MSVHVMPFTKFSVAPLKHNCSPFLQPTWKLLIPFNTELQRYLRQS